MIPEDTSANAIILTVVGAVSTGCLLMLCLFLYQRPDVLHRIMSRLRQARTAPATSTPPSTTGGEPPRIADTNQAELSAPPQIEPEVNGHNYSRSGLIALLSVQKTETGAYRWTANQIAAFVGGTRSEVLKEIGIYRPEKAVAKMKRPANGWQS